MVGGGLAVLAVACQPAAPNHPTTPHGASPTPVAVAGGTPAPTGAPSTASPTSPTPSTATTGAPTTAPTGVPSAAASTAASPGATAATLAGVVRLAAALASGSGAAGSRLISDAGAAVISNNGAGVISNNGGGVISNNGGSYRLATVVEDPPLAKARVRLMDASGAPVLGADGQALVATTDEGGRYAFAAPLGTRAYLVAVDVPGGRGELAAIAPHADATAPRTADVDLVSTLATGYIVNAYVAPQSQRDDALAKLSPGLEADVRGAARAALAAHAEATPTRLTRDAVIASVASLRARDAALNGELAQVRCALLAAGDCALREGELGSTVPVGVSGLVLSPDGGLFIDDLNKGVVWRLDRDDRVRTVYQGGAMGRDANGLNLARAAGLDQRGRLLMLDFGGPNDATHRVVRLEPVGAPSVLWQGPQEPKAIFGGPGDTALILTADGRFLTVAAGQPEKEVFRVAAADLPLVQRTNGLGGVDPSGALYLSTRQAGQPAVVRLDPVALTFKTMAAVDPASSAAPVAVAVDTSGDVFTVDAAKTVRVQRPGDTAPTLVSTGLPLGTWPDNSFGLGYAADGTAYFGRVNGVVRVKGGKADQVMGLAAGAVAPGDSDLKPYGLAVDTDGTLYVGEGIVLGDSTKHLYRYAPGKARELLAGGGTAKGVDIPGPTAEINMGTVLRIGPQHQVYMLEVDAGTQLCTRISRVDGAGQLKLVYQPDGMGNPQDFVVDADGQVTVLEDLGGASIGQYTGTRLVKLQPDGSHKVVLDSQHWVRQRSHMTLAPGGGLTLAEGSSLLHWSEADGLSTIATGAPFNQPSCVSVAPDGRIYVGWDGRKIWRFDGVSSWQEIPVPPPQKPAITDIGAGPVFGPDGTLYQANLMAGEVLRVAPGDLPP